MRRPQWSLLKDREQAQAQRLLRLQVRRPQRCEDRVRLRARLRCRKQALARLDELIQVRCPVNGPQRGHERPPYPNPERRPLRALERGPHQGQEFPL